MINLKFYLCQHGSKLSEHTTQHALDLAFLKSKKENIYKIIVPDLEVGLKIFSNNKFYGEILKITESLIYIKRPKDNEPIDCMIMSKDRFETFFMDKIFSIDIT